MKKSRIPFYYGVFIAIALIAYFLLLSLFDLHKNPFYSFFNAVITGVGMYACIKNYQKAKGSKFKYQKGFAALFTSGVIATVIFTFFFAFYATEIDPDFLEQLLAMWESDWYINIGMVIITVALMGFATSIVLALTFMQWFKRTWNTKEGREHTY